MFPIFKFCFKCTKFEKDENLINCLRFQNFFRDFKICSKSQILFLFSKIVWNLTFVLKICSECFFLFSFFSSYFVHVFRVFKIVQFKNLFGMLIFVLIVLKFVQNFRMCSNISKIFYLCKKNMIFKTCSQIQKMLAYSFFCGLRKNIRVSKFR